MERVTRVSELARIFITDAAYNSRSEAFLYSLTFHKVRLTLNLFEMQLCCKHVCPSLAQKETRWARSQMNGRQIGVAPQ